MSLDISKEIQEVGMVNKKKLNKNDEIALKVLNVNSLISVIFRHLEFSDLIGFSTVCKKWNLLTSSFIYKRINLLRSIDVRRKIYKDANLKLEDQIDAEVEECINSNAKYAHFVKKLAYYENLKPQRAIELFETFKFLTELKIHDLMISQDQFICMMKPLDKLEELMLSKVSIKEIKRKRIYNESIQLPHSLIKLSIINSKLVGNPALFVKTINSHSNLKELVLGYNGESCFMTPFCTYYPSLQLFKYTKCKPNNLQLLSKVLESNPQIVTLKLDSSLLEALTSNLCLYLTNLKELELCSSHDIIQKNAFLFAQPIKIKKLKLTFNTLTSNLLNSLLQSCPELEELIYEPGGFHVLNNISANVEKPTKIKKLRISKATFDDSSFKSIILNCPYLEDLDAIFPEKWKDHSDIISQKCTNLNSLTLYSFFGNSGYIEYYSLEFLSKNCSFKNNLTSLTLENFPFYAINSVHLQDYSNLKFIKFRSYHIEYEKNIDKVLSTNDIWSDYFKTPIIEKRLYGKTFKKYI